MDLMVEVYIELVLYVYEHTLNTIHSHPLLLIDREDDD
jgi:hypothetical protein